MNRKIILLLFCVSALIMYSCEGFRHGINKTWIEFQHNYCLINAKTAADSAACDRYYEQDLDEENERHDKAKEHQKEIDNCESFQFSVLKIWGYSDKEAKEGTKTIKKGHGNNRDFSFDCNEAISELIEKGYTDKTGREVFAIALPEFGLSSSTATNAIKSYYEDELYIDDRNPYHSKDPVSECFGNIRIGNSIRVTKALLIEMGLLDEDEVDDEVDDEGDDEGNEDENPPTNPESPTLDPNEPTDAYQIEVDAISKMAISQYEFNEFTLSLEQKQELDEVVAFMKKWPKDTITIVGHTCDIGSNESNIIVGMRRAYNAKEYLMSQGIQFRRIKVESKAASFPCVSNETEEGRLQNRRITFTIN